jgi:hypothetical protein
MDKQKIIDVQDKAVHCFANAATEKWDFILVNCETRDFEDYQQYDVLAISFAREKNAWKHTSIQAPYQCCDLLLQLCMLMGTGGKRAWESCTLEIESGGKYRYSFSYERPKRFNGIFDDEALFNNYTPRLLD